jgi:L-iditol 2-dehydrogenase
MNKTMQAAIMTGIGRIEWATWPIPAVADDEVLVKIEHVGVCGSDLHYYEHGRIGGYIVDPPFVLGHEAAGVVVETGRAVTHLRIGDRVALEPGKTCGTCAFCRSGRYNLCPDVIFFATPPVDGVFQEYVAHAAALCFPLPAAVDTLSGALIEPLAVGLHAARQGGAQMGQTAVVFGAGCIGLVTLLSLRAMGLGGVTVVDVLPNRLAKARELGAAATVDASGQDAAAVLRDLTGGCGFDLAIETSGSERAAAQAIQTAQKGATVVLVGYSRSGEMSLPMSQALDKELTFKTVFRYRHLYPEAIRAVADGLINLKQIVTHTFDFANIAEALDACVHNKAEIVKAVIRVGRQA